jgi:urate oxidase
VTLGRNNYGKAEIHLVHLDRDQPQHRVTDLTVSVDLEGDFDAAHVDGDNTGIVATDSQKNIVYGLARSEPPGAPERFALRVADYLVGEYPRSAAATGSGGSRQPWSPPTATGT